MKRIKVRIEHKKNIVTLEAFKGKQLKGVLSDAGFNVSYPCGGAGRCGKCRVRFAEGAPIPNTLDKTFLSEKDIACGVRLLCRCSLETDCSVSIDDSGLVEEDIVAETARSVAGSGDYDKYGIAVDIGTTTIAAALVGVSDEGGKEILHTASCVNHQRRFGADVISRIAYASGAGQDVNANKLEELKDIVRKDISGLITDLTAGIEEMGGGDISQIVVTGNTTMLHIKAKFL